MICQLQTPIYLQSFRASSYFQACTSCNGGDEWHDRLPPIPWHETSNPGLHAQFVDSFCSKLRQSSRKDFQTISGCQINFTYSPDVSTTIIASPPGSINGINDGKSETDLSWGRRRRDIATTIGGEVHITHMSAEEDGSSTMDLALLGKAVVDAYNEVHADTPYSMTSFSLQRIIEVPEDDADGEDDDEDNGDEDELYDDDGDDGDDGPDIILKGNKNSKKKNQRRKGNGKYRAGHG